MKLQKVFILSILGIALSGCDQTHDVPYYKAHQDEMKKVFDECKKQASANWGANCLNAQQATREVNNGRFMRD